MSEWLITFDDHIERIRENERERIIVSLEFPNGWHETVYVAGEGDEHFASSCVTCLNIALIKGEK